ncbi:MAG TPA: hypothetical protein VKZ92_01875, partial [Pseudohongiella sp.]|nr:hypothetical protein [Pseudohongiella sp.]
MNTVLSRRRLLFGGAAFAGAAALDRMTGASSGLISSASAEVLNPVTPIRMSSNENPYGPSPKAIEAMQAAFGQSNLYGGIQNQIVEELAKIEGVPANCVTLSAGSGELLQA